MQLTPLMQSSNAPAEVSHSEALNSAMPR